MEKEKADLEQQLRSTNIQLQDAVRASELVKMEFDGVKAQLEQLTAENQPLKDAWTTRQDEIETLDSKATVMESKVGKYRDKRRTTAAKVEELQGELNEFREMLEQNTAQALQVHERVHVGEREEIQTMQDELRKKERVLAARIQQYVTEQFC